jgi:nucleoside-diphosphate-sugar epimerase
MSHLTTSSVSPANQPKSVLIAGCGYIGLRAARQFVAAGVRTFAITRSEQKAGELRAEGIEPIVMDLGGSSAWPPLPDADVVLWSVGYERVPGVDRSAVWFDGLGRLMDSMPSRSIQKECGRRVIYTSSTGVYGDGAGADVDELTPAIPVTEGGKACLAAESLLKELAAARRGEVIILRLAGIYGPDRLLRRISELRSGAPITSAPDDWLNLIHADDAVRMILFAAGSLELSNQMTDHAIVINVVAAGSVNRRQYYEELACIVGAPTPVFSASTSAAAGHPDRPTRGRSGNRRVISRLCEQLGVPFQFDELQNGLRDAVERSQTFLQR